MVIRVFGKSIPVSPLQFKNAELPMDKSPLLKPTSTRFVQPLKTEVPMVSRLFGRYTPVMDVLFRKTFAAISLTVYAPIVSGIITTVSLPVYPVMRISVPLMMLYVKAEPGVAAVALRVAATVGKTSPLLTF